MFEPFQISKQSGFETSEIVVAQFESLKFGNGIEKIVVNVHVVPAQIQPRQIREVLQEILGKIRESVARQNESREIIQIPEMFSLERVAQVSVGLKQESGREIDADGTREIGKWYVRKGAKSEIDGYDGTDFQTVEQIVIREMSGVRALDLYVFVGHYARGKYGRLSHSRTQEFVVSSYPFGTSAIVRSWTSEERSFAVFSSPAFRRTVDNF